MDDKEFDEVRDEYESKNISHGKLEEKRRVLEFEVQCHIAHQLTRIAESLHEIEMYFNSERDKLGTDTDAHIDPN